MKLTGKTRIGGTAFEIASDTKRVARYTMLVPARVVKLSIYVDGLGSGAGDQAMRGVIYDTAGLLVALGDEVVVRDGQAAGWVDLPFTLFPAGVALGAVAYDFGVIGGVQTNSIRVFGDDPGAAAFTGALPLTVSGNEITDVVRLAGLQGDGLAVPGGFGIWEATTNRMPYSSPAGAGQIGSYFGNAATGTTVAYDGVTLIFGAGTAKVACDGTAIDQGLNLNTAPSGGFAQLANQGAWTASAWVKTDLSGSFRVWIRFTYTDATTDDFAAAASVVALVGGAAAVRVTTTATPIQTAKTINSVQIFVRKQTTGAAFNLWGGGVQFENKPIATPLVATSGAAATRGAARVQAPASLLNATQGWIALRLRMGWNAAGPYPDAGLNPVFFAWSDGTLNNRISVAYDITGSKQFRVNRFAGGAGGGTDLGPVQAFGAGDSVTVIFQWSPTTLGLSINGGAFSTVADTNVPALTNTLFDLGSGGTVQPGQYADSSVLWAACGTGTLGAADAATLDGFGNVAPAFSALPGMPTMLWSAVDANYIVAQSGRTNIDTYTDGASNPFGVSTPLDEDMSVFATYTTEWAVPDVPEEQLAQLPWGEAQAVFGGSGVNASTVRTATLGFYGTGFDAERGALMLAAKDGAFADLVGKRVSITSGGRQVFVYCKGVASLNEGEDGAVTQRVYAALSLLSDVPIQVDLAEVS